MIFQNKISIETKFEYLISKDITEYLKNKQY